MVQGLSTEANGKKHLTFYANRSLISNKKDGLGIQLYPDGGKYEGMFKDGLFHGRGKMTQANGDVYLGQWIADKATGNGLFFDAA